MLKATWDKYAVPFGNSGGLWWRLRVGLARCSWDRREYDVYNMEGEPLRPSILDSENIHSVQAVYEVDVRGYVYNTGGAHRRALGTVVASGDRELPGVIMKHGGLGYDRLESMSITGESNLLPGVCIPVCALSSW